MTKIVFKQGQLHALALDEETVALVMSREEAQVVKDVLGRVTKDHNSDGVRWDRAYRVWNALHGLACIDKNSSNITGHLDV